MVHFTLDDIQHAFPRAYFSRGQAYQMAGRVLEVTMNESGQITGQVQGNDDAPYVCQIHVRPSPSPISPRPSVLSECSCPMGGYCKHAVATLLEWLMRQGQPAGALPSGRPKPPALAVQAGLAQAVGGPVVLDTSASAPDFMTQPAPAIAPASAAATSSASASAPKVSRELASWLDALVGITSPAAPASGHRLVYLLELPHGTVRLSLLSTRRLAKGGLGKPSPFRISRRFAVDYLQPDDEDILSGLEHLPEFNENTFELDGSYGAVMLNKLVATGRCYWQDINHTPLQPGDPLNLPLAWKIDREGIQRIVPVQSAAGITLLPLEPLYYIRGDTSGQGESCGEADTGLPPRLALRLLGAPPVKPHEVETLLPALPPGVPQPRRLPVRDVASPKPRPVLRLHTVPPDRLPRYTQLPWLRQGNLDMAKLSFDYAGILVKPGDRRTRFTRWENELLEQFPRDPAAEAAAKAELAGLGWLPLYELAPHLGPLGSEGLVLRPEGTARHKALRHPAQDWQTFIESQVPRLRAEGWQVEYDPSFHYGFVVPDAWHIALEDGESGSGMDWFGMVLEIEIAGERRPLLPILLSLLRSYPELALLDAQTHVQAETDRGERLSLPVARIRPLLKTLFDLFSDLKPDATRLTLSRLDAARLEELRQSPEMAHVQWRGGEAWQELGRRLGRFEGLQPITPPPELQAGLRPYQAQGVAWLQFLREYQLGGVLADDMGLGKTLQTLTHLLIEKNAGRLQAPSLIVAPTSLVHNWRREAERFAPTLRVLILHGSDRHTRFADLAGVDFAITTYPLLARDIEILAATPFYLLVLDEAQQVKNPKSQTARAVRALNAEHRLCLTGTPMENHLGELWALFDFLMPGWLGNDKTFNRLWRTPIEKHGDSARRTQLARRVSPFLLRRTKEQVATELPPKTETIQYVELDGRQRDLYETVRLAMNDKVRQEISQHGLARSQIVILEALLKLRQVCCDPRLVKLDAARGVGSAKLDALLEMLAELVAEGRRILLFSQFTSMLALVQEALATHKLEYVLLTGDTRDRQTPVERFQAGEVPIFLISLKAGGVGLNLTAADTVIHFDPWWNPAVENQATDRAYRIGQDKPVFVYKLVAKGTVEERIVELQRKKAELTAGVLGDEAAALTALSAEDWVELFGPIQ